VSLEIEPSRFIKTHKESLSSLCEEKISGYYLATIEARVYARLGDHRKALEQFHEALQKTYKCKLTSPRLTFAALPALADQAMLWFNIYQTHEGAGDAYQAAEAYKKAKILLREAIEIESEEKFESVAARIFFAHSIFQDSFK
jgi:tetratricopeptide (TPR) repeat protein